MNKPTWVRCGGLIIKTRPAGPRKEPVTVVVGKSVFKKAVERNLFKRRVRGVLMPLSKKLKIDFWVTAKPVSYTHLTLPTILRV